MDVRSGRVFALAFCSLVVGVVAAPAAEEDAVQKAIRNGVRFLKGIHGAGPNYNGGSHGMGTATLAGLAMLECGVPADDDAMKVVTRYVRQNALRQTATYELSLTIMFLDRLGDLADRPIIQLLGIRLVGGQCGNGGYTYDCGYGFTDEEEAQLRGVFFKDARLVSQPNKLPPAVKKDQPVKQVRSDIPFDDTFPPVDPKTKMAKDPPPKADPRPALHPLAEKFARLVNITNAGVADRVRNRGDGDNSNTQFATLGLWCARKHGVPCDGALAALELRFRSSQSRDGGWLYNYTNGNGGSTPAMTCAGLIALAASHGVRQSVLRNQVDAVVPPNKGANGKGGPENDAAINRGLKRLGEYITEAKGGLPRDGNRKGRVDDLNSNLYFLWSLERVAVIYGLATIGNHDWYLWGADALIETQQGNGSWDRGRFPGADAEISTAFALLFLSRANVARDLTAALNGKVADPAVATLRSGANVAAVEPKLPEKIIKMPTVAAPINSRTDLNPPSPPARAVDPFESEAAALSSSLLKATGTERSELLAKLKEGKGAVYSEALARAAAKAAGEFQTEIREAFSQRLTRMKAATLRGFLRDEDREVRLAAATACGVKADRQLVPDLIDAVADRDKVVVQAARTSLKSLTGQDFGPAFASGSADQAKAILGWKSWWTAQAK